MDIRENNKQTIIKLNDDEREQLEAILEDLLHEIDFDEPFDNSAIDLLNRIYEGISSGKHDDA